MCKFDPEQWTICWYDPKISNLRGFCKWWFNSIWQFSQHLAITVARKDQPSYKLYICRTNFIFTVQTSYFQYKLYICSTNFFICSTDFIFVLQTLHFAYEFYIPCTNFIFRVQTLSSLHKLLYSHTNVYIPLHLSAHFIYFKQCLNRSANLISDIQTLYWRQTLYFFWETLLLLLYKETCLTLDYRGRKNHIPIHVACPLPSRWLSSLPVASKYLRLCSVIDL